MTLTENHVICAFLHAEVQSSHFAKYIEKVENIEKLLFLPDFSSDEENKTRKTLLANFRGFGGGVGLGVGLKTDALAWELGSLPRAQFDTLRYLNHKHWNSLSKDTRMATVAADRVLHTQATPDSLVIIDICKSILNGFKFPPAICLEHEGLLYIVEGHKRVTAHVVVGVHEIPIIVGRGEGVAEWKDRAF